MKDSKKKNKKDVKLKKPRMHRKKGKQTNKKTQKMMYNELNSTFCIWQNQWCKFQKCEA